MSIIAISGKAGSGKDTLGVMIIFHLSCLEKGKTAEFESYEGFSLLYPTMDTNGWGIKKFATAVKKVAEVITGIPTFLWENQNIKSESLGEQWDNMTGREMLQKIGTDAMRNQIHPNVWVNAVMVKYTPKIHKWIITDLRFPNELYALQKENAFLIRVNRDSVNIDDTHISETALDNFDNWDCIVDNNQQLEDLFERAREIAEYIKEQS